MIKAHDSAIVKMVANLLSPPIYLFAVYVLFHGHYSPGGGFQAGVLIGAGIILYLLVHKDNERRHLKIGSEFLLAAIGVLIFVFVGLLSVLAQRAFLDYGGLFFLPTSEAMRRHWGIFFAECGVTIAVAMTVVVIFHVLAFPTIKEKT